VQEGHESPVRVLASLGTEVNTAENEGAASLCNAAHGEESVTRVLASLGTVVNTPGNAGSTQLTTTGSSDYLTEVTALWKRGPRGRLRYRSAMPRRFDLVAGPRAIVPHVSE
jgi:hypothetical protein